MNWIVFIFGVLAMWCLIGIVSIFFINSSYSHTDEYVIFVGGPVIWLSLLITYIMRLCIKLYRDMRYKAVVRCPDGEIRWIRSCKYDHIIEAAGYDRPYKTDEEKAEAYNKYWAKDKYAKKRCSYAGCPNIRYAPPSLWKQYESVAEYVKR